LGRRLQADMLQYSLPALLRYEDRNTMAFGVESRVPFVDHVFFEWTAMLPADMRLHHGWTKHVLRVALKDVLPQSVARRKSKLGFSSPVSKWLEDSLGDWLSDMLTTPVHLGEVVSLRGVRSLVERRSKGDRSKSLENLLVRLAIYEAWSRQFLGRNAPR
jgi:asparagine synthase (glutamine-hydrolysing)